MSTRVLLHAGLLSMLILASHCAQGQSARDGWTPVVDPLAQIEALLDAGDGSIYAAGRFDCTSSSRATVGH